MTRSKRRAGACFPSATGCSWCALPSASCASSWPRLGSPRIDAVLLDLGVSSPQLDAPARGFRFADATAAETPLDMRMDRRSPVTAAEILRTSSAEELATIFREGGELPGAGRLARRLIEARQLAPLRDDPRSAPRHRGRARGRRPPSPPGDARLPGAPDRGQRRDRGASRGARRGDSRAAPGRAAGGDRLPLARGPLREAGASGRPNAAAPVRRASPSASAAACRGCACSRAVRCGRVRPSSTQNPRARSARLRAAERIAEAA